MVLLEQSHRRERKESLEREQRLVTATLTKDPALYTAVLDAVRTDPVMRGKLMEIENELAINTQKAMNSDGNPGNLGSRGYPVT